MCGLVVGISFPNVTEYFVGQAKSISLAKFFDADGSLIGDHKWFLAVFRLRVRYWYVVLGQEAGILKS